MNKKKAIEAAIEKARARTPIRYWGLPAFYNAVADFAYEAGRIAGLREFVNLLPHAGMMRAIDTRRKFRTYANALAKKARAK